MKLDDAVAAFLSHLEAERRASPHTLEAYGRDLAGLVEFAREKREGKADDVRGIDVYLLRGWLGQLARTHAASSVARHIAAVRTWMRWLRRKGVLATNPAEELATPKVHKPLPTFLSVDAAQQVVEAADGDTPKALRDRAVLELLYGSGLRRGELVGLDLVHVDLAGATARVLGKGNKERIVPLGAKCIDALRRYL